jgi:ADP-heptose:LPS heptosyltransferase
MPTGVNLLNRVSAPFAGLVNRARLGFPRHFFRSSGLLGDDLMCTAVFREMKKRGSGKITMATRQAGLFERNPDVDEIIAYPDSWLERCLQHGLPVRPLTYTQYDPLRDADAPPADHALIRMFQLAGVGGPVELRPYLNLTKAEFAAGKLGENQVVMQSTTLGSTQSMRNKEWYPQRFQEVCNELRLDLTVIQLGSADDPRLQGAIDLRGKTTVRQAAGILAQSLAFIGLVSFLMHLARAVDCRSVIIFGGREKPSQTGYVANKNLYQPVPCAPCWLRNPCDFDRKCMNLITTEQVIAATAEQISRYGTLLEVQTANL